MWEILLVLSSLFLLFINGAAVLFFLNYLKPREKFSNIELVVYSFTLGYAILTFTTLALAEVGLLIFPFNLFVVLIMPILALCFYVYRKQINKQANNEPSPNTHKFSSILRLSSVVLIAVFALGIILRLETQLTTTWLGDMDPYYHLTFIDSIITQGTLPSRTLWGFYSYPPSFHTVFAALISTTQVDRFLFMKIVPEFLGFLSVPAVYILIKKKYGEWPGIASAAFLAISSFHITRTNIAIPESVALLGMIMFFLALTTQTGLRKYILSGIFASMVFLTNVVGIIYFVPCILGIFIVLLLSNKWEQSFDLLKVTLLGLILSGLFWLPTLDRLGLNGIFQGLGPSAPQAAIIYTSNTYLALIGWGAIIFAVIGAYVCLKDFKNHVIFWVPVIIFLFLFEASNNGYNFLETNLLFRGLLYLGTWVALLAGIGFSRMIKPQKNKTATIILIAVVVLTMVSFPVFSHGRYPVIWGNDNVDFVYRSYLNFSEIFKGTDYTVYSSDWEFNYGAFNNVILNREVPQLKEALLKNDSSTVTGLINKYNIRYLILRNGTTEASFLAEVSHVYQYYENWHTIVFVIE